MHRSWFVFVVALTLASAGLDAVAGEIEVANAAYDAGDFAKAAPIYKDLAGRGDPQAEMRMGMLYQFGQSVERDYPSALQWYEKSAAQGNQDAQHRLENLRARMGINARRNEDIAHDAEIENGGKRSGAVMNFTGQVLQGLAPVVGSAAATAQSRAPQPAAPAKTIVPYSAAAGHVTCPPGYHLFSPYGGHGICQPNVQGSATPSGTNQSTITGGTQN
jgi:hypothetical protein